MNLEELWKNARSLHPEERPPGACIAEIVTDTEIFYFYGPDEEKEYRYRTAADLYYINLRKKHKHSHLKEELKEVINIYIDTDMKGMKGKADYGFYLEWERPGMPIETRSGYGSTEDTRNRLFLKAAAEALERIKKVEEVHVYAPCQYMVESANKGMPEIWVLHAWIKGDRSEVKNRDLWERLLPKLRELKPIWHDGRHAYTDVILRDLRERRKNGITGNGAYSDTGGYVRSSGESPYHF